MDKIPSECESDIILIINNDSTYTQNIYLKDDIFKYIKPKYINNGKNELVLYYIKYDDYFINSLNSDIKLKYVWKVIKYTGKSDGSYENILQDISLTNLILSSMKLVVCGSYGPGVNNGPSESANYYESRVSIDNNIRVHIYM